MPWFKGDDSLPDEEIDMEEQRAAAIRLSTEMSELSTQLLQKARELKRELEDARKPAPR